MIGVIADDLSGAAEIGGVGLRHGLRAEIVVLHDAAGSEFRSIFRRTVKGGQAVKVKAPAAGLICVDTDSRACTEEEAGERAAAAAKWLFDSGANWIYQKVDSVLRGHLVPELEATMKQLGLTRALLAPANPSLGRVISRGRYSVRGKPMPETEFARDPEYPRTSAKVLELLGPPQNFTIQLGRAQDSLPDSGIVVGEAATAGDLRRWAARRNPGLLLAGAAEFFAALLVAEGRASSIAPPVTALPDRRELFVCGTASNSARDFLKAARERKTPIFSLPSELVWGAEFSRVAVKAIAGRAVAAFGSRGRVILHIGLPAMRGPEASRLLTQCLVQLAAAVIQQTEVGHVYAEGGATAAALVRRLGWTRLNVLRELAPGVATLAVAGNKALRLTIKPGSYPWPAAVRKEADFPASD